MTTLRQRMLEDMQIRNLSPRTQNQYLVSVSAFAKHLGKPPDRLWPEEIRSYELFLFHENGWPSWGSIELVGTNTPFAMMERHP